MQIVPGERDCPPSSCKLAPKHDAVEHAGAGDFLDAPEHGAGRGAGGGLPALPLLAVAHPGEPAFAPLAHGLETIASMRVRIELPDAPTAPQI